MENYCHTHHANHSERTCHEFINYFTAFLTPRETPKREKMNEKEEEEGEEEPPSHLNLIWDEEEFGNDEYDDIIKEACIGNDYNLWSKRSPKTNYSTSTLKTNSKSSTSKQASTDKFPEKEKEKENAKEKEKERESIPGKSPISLDLTQKILGATKF